MQRLKPKEIKAYREQQWASQKGICPLCQQYMEPSESVADHRHSDGLMRRVIHRFCNTFLGKIENNVKRNRITDVQLGNILKNYQSYIDDVQEVLHPTHLTPEERRARATKRAKKRRQLKKK